MKKIIIASIILVGAILAWMAWKGKFSAAAKAPESAPKAETPEKSVSQSGAFTPTTAKTVQDKVGFPLMQGSRGEYVKLLQDGLNKRYASDLAVDGIFGPKTAKALRAHNFLDVVTYDQFYTIIGINQKI